MGNKIESDHEVIEPAKKEYIIIDSLFHTFWENQPIREMNISDFVDLIMTNKHLFLVNNDYPNSFIEKSFSFLKKIINFNSEKYIESGKLKLNIISILNKYSDPYYIICFIFFTKYNKGLSILRSLELIYYEFLSLGILEYYYHKIPDLNKFIINMLHYYIYLVTSDSANNLLLQKIQSSTKEKHREIILKNFTVYKVKNNLIPQYFYKINEDIENFFINNIFLQQCSHSKIRYKLYEYGDDNIIKQKFTNEYDVSFD